MTASNVLTYIGHVVIWLALFNVFVFGILAYLRSAANTIKNWPSVPGSITSSRVSYESSYRKTGATPYVRYHYEVQGKTYKEGHLFPGIMMVAGQANAEKFVARYPAGADVTVYYNPKDPSQAVLEKDATAQTSGMCSVLVFGNFLIPVAVLIAKLVFKVG